MQVSAAPTAGRREWLGLVVIALPCLLYSMDLTVLNGDLRDRLRVRWSARDCTPGQPRGSGLSERDGRRIADGDFPLTQ